MTGRQEYDRTKDRQRILDEYMIDIYLQPHGPKGFFYNFLLLTEHCPNTGPHFTLYVTYSKDALLDRK